MASHFLPLVPLPQVFGFFKGMSFPVASIAVYNSVVFGVFSNTERFLSRHRCREPEAGPGRSLSDLVLASMVAGMVSVGLGGPAELIKIRLQMQTQPFREGKRPTGENPVLRTCDLSALGWIWGALVPSLVSDQGCSHPVHYKRGLSFSLEKFSMLLLKVASTEEGKRKGCMLYVSFDRVLCQRRKRRRGHTLWWSRVLGEAYFNASEFCSWFFY